MKAPAPGIYPGVPETHYRAWEAECQSSLKIITQRSEAHYQHGDTVPSEPSTAMELGTAFHTGLQEPRRWEAEYVRGISVDRRTTKGKAAWAAFLAENAGKAVLKPDDFDRIEGMRDAVLADPTCHRLMTARGGNEVSVVARDPETGLLLKGRLDRLTEWDGYPAIVDWKSCEDASEDAAARSSARYGYYFQAAFYLHLLECLAPGARRFLLAFVEKSPPYCSAVYEVDEQDIDQGRAEFRSALNRLAAARESGIWPGYHEGVKTISLPRWARRDPEYIE